MNFSWIDFKFPEYVFGMMYSTPSLSHFREPYGAASIALMWFSIVLSLTNKQNPKIDFSEVTSGGNYLTIFIFEIRWSIA